METCSYQKFSIEVEEGKKLSIGNLEKQFMRLPHRFPQTKSMATLEADQRERKEMLLRTSLTPSPIYSSSLFF